MVLLVIVVISVVEPSAFLVVLTSLFSFSTFLRLSAAFGSFEGEVLVGLTLPVTGCEYQWNRKPG
jgi:hypothetical protein